MTRKEAIKVLKKDLQIIDDPNVTMTAREWEEHDDNMRDALDMAIKTLQHEQERREDIYECPNCLGEVHINYIYCPFCGIKVESDEQ